MLDPVARHDFMATMMTAAAGQGNGEAGGVSVLLSSHVLAELERVASYLILLSRGRVQVAGEVGGLLAGHRRLTGPAAEAGRYAGPQVVHARRAGAEAHLQVRAAADDQVPPVNSATCAGLALTFSGMNGFLANGSILQAVPVLVGAFAGAPILARELETGTFRYAWTLPVVRWRWTLAKLVPLAVAAAAAAGALSLLLSWYYQPYFAAGNQALGLNDTGPFYPGPFDLRGVGFAAWTLAAFAIGALAGMLIRRVVPAIVATLAAYAALALAAGAFLREHYLPPLLTTNVNLPGSAWIISQWWTRDGRFAFGGFPPTSLLERLCPPAAVGPAVQGGQPKVLALAQCLSRHGYTQWTSYQPASRFWPFQWIEGGWLLALSVLLIAVTVWLVRRRPI